MGNIVTTTVDDISAVADNTDNTNNSFMAASASATAKHEQQQQQQSDSVARRTSSNSSDYICVTPTNQDDCSHISVVDGRVVDGKVASRSSGYSRLLTVADLAAVKADDIIAIATLPKVSKRDLQFDLVSAKTAKRMKAGKVVSLPDTNDDDDVVIVIEEACPVAQLPTAIKRELSTQTVEVVSNSGNANSGNANSGSSNNNLNSNKDTVAIKTTVSIAVNRIVQDTLDNTVYYVVGKLIYAAVAHGYYYPEGTVVDNESSVYKAILKFDSNGKFVNYSDIGGYPNLAVSHSVSLIFNSR